MRPVRLVDLQRQFVRVGALQFADAAVIDDDSGQLVIVCEFRLARPRPSTAGPSASFE